LVTRWRTLQLPDDWDFVVEVTADNGEDPIAPPIENALHILSSAGRSRHVVSCSEVKATRRFALMPPRTLTQAVRVIWA